MNCVITYADDESNMRNTNHCFIYKISINIIQGYTYIFPKIFINWPMTIFCHMHFLIPYFVFQLIFINIVI